MKKSALWLMSTTAMVALGTVPALAQTGSAKSVSTLNTEVNSQYPDNNTGVITPRVLRQVTLDQISSSANLITVDQTLVGGANVTSFSNGTFASGTLTVDCGQGPLQFFLNTGSVSIASPTHDGSCIVVMTNGSNVGVPTFSGFNVGSNTGDSLTTTGTSSFSLSIWRVTTGSGSIAAYNVTAHQ